MKRLAFTAVAVLIAVACNHDRTFTGPKAPKAKAHIPSFSSSSTTSSGASFATDKDDYAPGETVILTGAGWPAGEVAIHLDRDPQTLSPEDWTATADDAGSFTSTYSVKDGDAGVTLTITATANGETATATFTDTPPVLSPTNVTWSGNGTTNGVCDNVGSFEDLNPGPGQQGWLFILTQPYDNSGSDLTTSFNPSTQSPSNPISGTFVSQSGGGTYHYVVYTSIGATLLSASATNGTLATFSSGNEEVKSNLTVSHCESGGGGAEAEAPTISKDAGGSYKNTYAWSLTKDVDKTTVKKIGGGTATFNYTIAVTHDGGTISDVKVSGTITVHNPNAANITGADVTDALSDATNCTVTGGAAATLAPGDNTFAYSCDLTGLPQGQLDNTATVTWGAQTVDGKSLAAGSADFKVSNVSFTENAIDECVSVDDSYQGNLGSACVGDDNPKSFSYSRTITVPTFDCQSYDNTATYTTNDTGATDSKSKTVTVCGPARTGALTIGFWKNTNGQNLIKTYCGGVGGLATYLAGLGGGSGPFATATSYTSCTSLAGYVYGILNGASASDMNKMLKAQMLGTALDVWFSGPGWTSTKSGGIKPPSNFLSHNNLGTFKMDVTAVCPMVDNLNTGSATCQGNTPSTDAVAAGLFTSSPVAMQAILDYAATTPSPFSASVWYGGNRTKQEILKNIFDQFNNQLAFGSF